MHYQIGTTRYQLLESSNQAPLCAMQYPDVQNSHGVGPCIRSIVKYWYPNKLYWGQSELENQTAPRVYDLYLLNRGLRPSRDSRSRLRDERALHKYCFREKSTTEYVRRLPPGLKAVTHRCGARRIDRIRPYCQEPL